MARLFFNLCPALVVVLLGLVFNVGLFGLIFAAGIFSFGMEVTKARPKRGER